MHTANIWLKYPIQTAEVTEAYSTFEFIVFRKIGIALKMLHFLLRKYKPLNYTVYSQQWGTMLPGDKGQENSKKVNTRLDIVWQLHSHIPP